MDGRLGSCMPRSLSERPAMADRSGKLMAELGAPSQEKAGARQEGFPIAWPLADDLAIRLSLAAVEGGPPRVANMLCRVFQRGQEVGHGTAGPAIGCPSCGRRAGFGDCTVGPNGARCLLCDHTWEHKPGGKSHG